MYLVTGATGTVGRHLVERLRAAGVGVRATSREPATAGLPAGVEVIRTDPDAYPLAGVTAAFLNPAAVGDAGAFLDQAARHGVGRVVVLSTAATLDAANPIGAHHLDLEDRVRASGLAWTLLRPGAFASNCLAWAPQLRAGDTLRAPYGQARTAPVDERDVAALADHALRTDALVGAAPLLTGPDPLTQADQLAVLGTALGRTLRWVELDHDTARRDWLAAGLPALVVDGLLRYQRQAVTGPTPPAATVTELLGVAAHPFARWATEHAADFR